MTFSPTRPYFIRAFHEWLTDNDLTPYLVVDSTHKDLVAPTEFAQDGVLVLSFSHQATHNLVIDNDYISFSARFGGVSKDLWIPMQAVLAVRAKEAPEVFFPFNPEEYANYVSPAETKKPAHKTSKLKLIK